MKLARQVLRYLAGTAALKLHMGGASSADEVILTRYTNADYAADKATRNSISGAVLLVDWMSSEGKSNISPPSRSHFRKSGLLQQLLVQRSFRA